MWESVAAPMVAMTAALAGVSVTPTPAPPVDAAPVLTSTPFGALPGQRVTHTITISGAATLTGARITFTTTADLDGVTAQAEPGWCDVAVRTVVCDLGDVRLAGASAAPRVTITGRVRPGAAPGTLVRNLVSLTSAQLPAADPLLASNAYLLPGSTTPATDPPQEAAAATTDPAPGRSARTPIALAVLVGALAAGAVLTRRRLRQRRALPPHDEPAVTTGRPDPM
ncbi:hypothetical protein [Micromonospora coerulea]|uniref:hypothetical protein n=1 Tax=Micromonospora coerulea TaxID=47856 RepID=UPI0031F95EEA